MPENERPRIFISRAGEDADVAATIGRILQGAGYTVILQQWNFTHQNFIARMHDALGLGTRVIALLSSAYMKSEFCEAEWTTVLSDDPTNRECRLVVMRISDCKPTGLLSAIGYTDLVHVLADSQALPAKVLAAIGHSDAGPRLVLPDQSLDPEMPRPVANFTGRRAELGALESLLWHGDGRTVIVHGFAGTGKSTLARAYASQCGDRYGIVAWLTAETENGIIDGLLRLGSLIDPRIPRIANRRDAAQRVTEMGLGRFGKPTLLIFDNLDDERLLRKWNPRSGAHVIATSRNARWAKDVSEIPLDIWPVGDAVHYLRGESGRDDLVDADVHALAEALGNLPLALSQAAAYLKATWTVNARDYLGRIAYHLANPPRGAEDRRAVFATFQAALAKAEEQAPGAAAIACLAAFFAPDAIPEELFQQNVGVYPEDLRPDVPGVAPVLDLRSTVTDPVCFKEALGALDRLSLISFAIESRVFNMHRVVQAAARDLARGNEGWQPASVSAVEAAFPSPVYENWAICERHLAHALSVLDNLPSDGVLSAASRLAGECGSYLRQRAAYGQAERLLLRALEMDEKLYGPKHSLVAVHLAELGRLLRLLGRFGSAERTLRRALEIVEETVGKEHSDTGSILLELGRVLRDTGKQSEAERIFRRTLTIFEQSSGPDSAEVAIALGEIANILVGTERLNEAEELARRALAIDEKMVDANHPDIGYRLSDIARVLTVQNHLDEAESLLWEVLAIREKSFGPEHPMTSVTLTDLGRLLRRTNRPEEAEQLFRRALAIDERAFGPHHRNIAIDLLDVASLLTDAGKSDDAAPLLKRAAEIDEIDEREPADPE